MRELRPLNPPTLSVPPVPPPPQGDDLEDFLDECCLTIENLFGALRRLPPDLGLDNGQHSLWLTDGIARWQLDDHGQPSKKFPSRCGAGIRAWIVHGTLRTPKQLTEALNAFLADRRIAVRRRKIDPDWKLTINDIWTLGKQFGLPGPPPPPTAEEIAARQATEAEKRRKDAADIAQEKERAQQWEVNQEIIARKKRLLKHLSLIFYTMDDLDFSAENLPARYHEVKRKRQRFEDFSRDLVNLKIDQGKSDETILEEMTMFHSLIQGDFCSIVPDPIEIGQVRHFVEPKDLANFMTELDASGAFEKYDSSIAFGMDSRFTVTLSPKQEAK